MTANTAGILNYRVSGVQNPCRIFSSHPSGVQNTCRIFSPHPSVVQNTCRIGSTHPSAVPNTDPSRPLRPLRSPKNGRVTSPPPPPQSQKRTRHPNPAPTFVPLTGMSDGAYAIRPYPDEQKTGTEGVGRCPFFIRQTIRRPLCVRRNGIGPQAPGKTSCKDAPGNPSVRSGA